MRRAALGNYPVDLLACVPPSLVNHDHGEAFSLPGRRLVESGKAVSDASAVDVRAHFPTDRDALRIVQYDSCRGLEGWTVINYGFDDFWTCKHQQWLDSPQEPGGLFDTPEERAAAFASRWAMIPLTRAMDTLVVKHLGATKPHPGRPCEGAVAAQRFRRVDYALIVARRPTEGHLLRT